MDVNTQLHNAIRAKNLPEVVRLLELPGIDINKEINGLTPLFAVITNRIDYPPELFEILDRLLAFPGIDVNKLNQLPVNNGRERYRYNAMDNEMDLMEEHEMYSPDRGRGQSPAGKSPLTYMLGYVITKSKNRLIVVKKLLNHPNIDINKTCLPHNETPLLVATDIENVELIGLLLSKLEIDVNKQNVFGETALHIACSSSKPAIIRLLLAKPSINVNVGDDSGKTPLMESKFCPRCIKLLLAHPDIDVNRVDSNGNTMLMNLSEYKWEKREIKWSNDEVKLLLNANADLLIRNKEGKSAEDLAIEKGNLDIVRTIQSAVTKLRGRNLATFIKGTKVTKKSSNEPELSNGTKKSLGLPNMPSDVMNRIGSFFSGKTGSLNQQRFKLRSNLEYRNEPSVRPAGGAGAASAATGAGAASGSHGGGRRRTRRGGSKHRKANRSRRNRQ